MAEAHFLVSGSNIEPYRVSIVFRDGQISAICDCPAAGMGWHCKHRINILNGITQGIVSGNKDEVLIVQSWLPGTEVEQALQTLQALEEKLALLKKQVAEAKKSLVRSFDSS